MFDNRELVREIEAKFEQLSPGDRLYLVGRIVGGIRKEHFTDHERIAREAEEMANDPGIQRVLRGGDLPLDHLYCPPESLGERAAS